MHGPVNLKYTVSYLLEYMVSQGTRQTIHRYCPYYVKLRIVNKDVKKYFPCKLPRCFFIAISFPTEYKTFSTYSHIQKYTG